MRIARTDEILALERQIEKEFGDRFYDPMKFSLIDGEDAVLDDVMSYQIVNEMKNHWAGASAPSGIQTGMIRFDTDDNEWEGYDGTALRKIASDNSGVGLENLFTNRDLSVWSDSPDQNGYLEIAFDSGSEAPSLHDRIDGADSGSYGRVFKCTVSTGTWGGGDAAGTLYLYNVSGAFIDNENLDINGGTANVMTVNGEPGVSADDCRDDGTGDWTDADSILAFDTDHYTLTGDADEKALLPATLTNGYIYRICMEIKDGTEASKTLRLVSGYSSTYEQYSKLFTTTAAWVQVEMTFAASGSTAFAGVNLEETIGNIQIRNVSIMEVCPCVDPSGVMGPDGWGSFAHGFRDQSNAGDNSLFCVSVNRSTASATISWPSVYAGGATEEFYKKFRGRTVTAVFDIKTSKASHARVRILGGSATVYSDYHSGGGDWETLSATSDISTSGQFSAAVYVDNAGEIGGDTIVRIRNPRLVFGSVIPVAACAGVPEMIMLQQRIRSEKWSGISGLSNSSYATKDDFNPCADSKGRLPFAPLGALVYAQVSDSASSGVPRCGMGIRINPDADMSLIANCAGLANSAHGVGNFWIGNSTPTSQWDVYLFASGAGTLSVNNFEYKGVLIR